MSTNRINKNVYLISNCPEEFSALTAAVNSRGLQLIKDETSGSEELLNRICTIHPDLIFLDALTYRKDLSFLLQGLKENIETASTPIFLVIPNGQPADHVPTVTDYGDVTTISRDANQSKINDLLEDALKPAISIRFWGVRGSTPCANKQNIIYGGNTTCVQVELPFSDELLILDSGTGIRNLGNYLNTYRSNISGNIFITHPHWDHIQGFPFFKPIYHSGNSFKLHMPPQVTGGCREILSGHLTKTFFPVTLEMFDADLDYITLESKPHHYPDYSIEYLLANHPINTAIYKLNIAGKTIVFCPDNELTPIEQKTNAFFYTRLKAFFWDADLLIHDAQYNLEEYKQKEKWGHSAWETVVDFARRAKVKNLILTHHDPDSTDLYLQELDEHIQQQFKDDFESIQLAREGVKMQMRVNQSG